MESQNKNQGKQTIYSYKELIVWQKAIELGVSIYEITEKFPRAEVYGLTSQMRRASVSIASNIAEGRSRGTKNEFVQFLRIAIGSAAELETQIVIAKKIAYLKENDFSKTDSLLGEVLKILYVMIRKLNPKSY